MTDLNYLLIRYRRVQLNNIEVKNNFKKFLEKKFKIKNKKI